MNAVAIEGISTNPEIDAIADRVFHTVRLSIERATKALNSPSPNLPQKGIEKDAFDFFTKYKAINQIAVSRLAGLPGTGQGRFEIKPLRNAVTFNLTAATTVLEQANTAKFFSTLKLTPDTSTGVKTLAGVKSDGTKFVAPGDVNVYAKNIIEFMAFKRFPGDFVAPAAQPTTPAATELRLKLTRLKAIRRFGWEITDFGDDEIACGGDGFDSTAQHITAPAFNIHTFKRDGEGFDINPDRTFIKFDLSRAGLWPRAFSANVFLAEKDVSGGFVDFLTKLWDAIGTDVITLATTLAASALGLGAAAAAGSAGAAAGATAGSAMPLVGTIVGAVIGAVIGLVVAWLIDSLKDDLFVSPENPLGVVLTSPNALFPGNSKKSPLYLQEFNSGPGRYFMSYYWELV